MILKCVSLGQWFSTGGGFIDQGTFGNVWRHSWLSQIGSGGDYATST